MTDLLAYLGDGAFSVLAFLVAILIIVAVHEYGHYIVGRLSGIHAEVFSLGFGKVLFSRTDRHGTRWQLAAIPLGGYVKFLGDANASSANPDEATMSRLSEGERRRTMHGAPLWARAATVLAGPMFNVLLTIAVFALMLMTYGVLRDETPVVVKSALVLPGAETPVLQPGDKVLAVDGVETPDLKRFYEHLNAMTPAAGSSWTVERGGEAMTLAGPYPLPAVVGAVMSKSAAMDAGLQAGDVILAANGKPVQSFGELPVIVEATAGEPVALTVWRAGEVFDLSLTPRRRDLPAEGGGFETRWLIGLTSATAIDLEPDRAGPLEAAGLALERTWEVTKSSVSGILAIIRGRISSCNVSGAITMATVVGDAASQGLDSFLFTLAALSLGIGIMNLFPIPVLDGGHLVFHAYEALRGKPPSPAFLARATMIGLILVLSLMVFALRNDIFCT